MHSVGLLLNADRWFASWTCECRRSPTSDVILLCHEVSEWVSEWSSDIGLLCWPWRVLGVESVVWSSEVDNELTSRWPESRYTQHDHRHHQQHHCQQQQQLNCHRRLWLSSRGRQPPSSDSRPNNNQHSTTTSSRMSAGFWLGGSMPPCRLRQRKFWKFDYEMVHSEVLKNALFFACFCFVIFHPFFQGGSADPICLYVQMHMHIVQLSPSLYQSTSDYRQQDWQLSCTCPVKSFVATSTGQSTRYHYDTIRDAVLTSARKLT